MKAAARRCGPPTAASLLAMPLLVCIAEKETAASPALTADMVSRAPRAEVHRYPIGHVDAYIGEWFEWILSDQISFLHAQLGIKTVAGPETDRYAEGPDNGPQCC